MAGFRHPVTDVRNAVCGPLFLFAIYLFSVQTEATA